MVYVECRCKNRAKLRGGWGRRGVGLLWGLLWGLPWGWAAVLPPGGASWGLPWGTS